jgi:hypothetical protein
VNAEERAEDEGCDGWSPKPAIQNSWLGESETCWQLKSGTAGQPKKLTGEIKKPIPSDTLRCGGRFVLVASGSTNGKTGEEARLKVLRQGAQSMRLPSDKIVVFGSEAIAEWCNQHPAIAAEYAGHPNGLWRLVDWARSPEHTVAWQSTQQLDEEIQRLRKELDFMHGSVTHLHIQGAPGVGKSRFALELCRDADWRSTVIYVRQASDLRLIELIDSATLEEGALLMIVADEVQSGQLLPLCDSLLRGNGRVRLITIGHTGTPDPARIPAIRINPLPTEALAAVIHGWYPAMPREHVEFVANFADGYVRLAKLAADAIVKNSSIDVRTLLDLDHIRQFFDRMLELEGADRRALHVVAALTSVGWTDDRQLEGEAIARHLGLDWNSVRHTVEIFHNKFGIAPRGGRLRYISPTPLGIYLAVEAWTSFPDLMSKLPDVLPTQEARAAYDERLKQIGTNLQVQRFARAQLSFFFEFDKFLDEVNVRRWSALSSADPSLAASGIMKALSSVDTPQRLRLVNQARRQAVFALVRLAWRTSSFHDATIALALLAEAENETWGNNATGEFVARFQVYLGGTAVPYVVRLSVLDELLSTGRPELKKLVVKALAKIGDDRASRLGSDLIAGELPETEWMPKTVAERRECFDEAMSRLIKLATNAPSYLQNDLMSAAQNLVMLLRVRDLRTSVTEFFRALHISYPETRERLRRIIDGIIRRERKYWKELSEVDLTAIEQLAKEFEENSLHGRLLREVGQHAWDREYDSVDLSSLAAELVKNPQLLASEWSWLTSGQAAEGWLLGRTLAGVDVKGELDAILAGLPDRGDDLRVICGFLKVRQEQNGAEWLDKWLSIYAVREPPDISLFFEVSWRCEPTPLIARHLADILRNHDVAANVIGPLGFGRWGENLPIDVLDEVLNTLADHGHEKAALSMIDNRLDAHPSELSQWKALALKLVTNPRLIREMDTVSYYWGKLAEKLLPENAAILAAAVFRAQADRQSGHWFSEFSQSAGKVLREAAAADPSGVWNSLVPYLLGPNAHDFVIGFAPGVMECVPTDLIEDWMVQNEERAPLLADLIGMNLSSDDTLAARILGKFGDNEKIANAFYARYTTGSWSGEASQHFLELADRLTSVANNTSLPKLRAWAKNSSHSLRLLAQHEAERELEWDLRRR